MTTMKLLILPGDGIGPEVMAEVRKVIDWFGAKRGLEGCAALDPSDDHGVGTGLGSPVLGEGRSHTD